MPQSASQARSRPEPTPSTWSALKLLVSGLAITTMVACERAPSLDLLPSQVGVEPGPEYRVALDSSRAFTRRAMARMYMPGVSVAVGQDGEIVWSEGFGWSDLSRKTPVMPLSLYPAGSISKSMTSVAVGVLLER